MRRGPFVRWHDLPQGRLPTPADAPQQPPLTQTEWIRNDSGGDLPAGSVVQSRGHVVSAAEQPTAWRSHVSLRVSLPDADHAPGCGILPWPVPDGQANLCLFAGVAYARLSGPTGQPRGGVQSGSPVLLAGEQGLCEILDDPGPSGEERLAIVRIGAGDGRTDTGGDGGGGICGCSHLPVGSETCLVEDDSPAVFLAVGLGRWLESLGFDAGVIDLNAIPLEFDGECTWISDELTRNCGYGYGSG